MSDPPGEEVAPQPGFAAELAPKPPAVQHRPSKPLPDRLATRKNPPKLREASSNDSSTGPCFKQQVYSVLPVSQHTEQHVPTPAPPAAQLPAVAQQPQIPNGQDLPSFKDQVYEYGDPRRRTNLVRDNRSHETMSSGTSTTSQRQQHPAEANVARAELLTQQPRALHSKPASVPDDTFYPCPDVFHVKVRKPLGPIGMVFRRMEHAPDQVSISKIHPGSPFQDTSIVAGQRLLSINGCQAVSPSHAVSVLRDIPAGASLTLSTCAETPVSNLCKLAVELCFKHNPGVLFEDCCGGNLVRIAQIFVDGPFPVDGSQLSVSDIVLAVNGIPVSSAHEARTALRLSLRRKFVELYVIDQTKLKEKVRKRAETHFEAPADFGYSLQWRHDDSRVQITIGTAVEKALGRLWMNPKTLLIEYPNQDRPIVSSASLPGRYRHGKSVSRNQNCKRFVDLFNHLMDMQLNVIVKAVCCQVWKHASQEYEASTIEDETLEPSIAMAEVLEIPVAENEYFG